MEPWIDEDSRVAIIGMAGLFPGARDVAAFWRNVSGGVESITTFSDAELAAAGVSLAELADPDYVKAGAVLEDIEAFDAGFFGLAPREVQIIDPQQRLFLETAWTALEAAGCDPGRLDGSVGVFAGAALSTYLINNLLPNPDVAQFASRMQLALGNDKDSLATWTAYALDVSIQVTAVPALWPGHVCSPGDSGQAEDVGTCPWVRWALGSAASTGCGSSRRGARS